MLLPGLGGRAAPQLGSAGSPGTLRRGQEGCVGPHFAAETVLSSGLAQVQITLDKGEKAMFVFL